MDAIRTFQTLGLTTSLILSGINLGSSFLTMPLLYSQPISISTALFKDFYLRGAVSLVPLGIFSASCSAVVAYLLSPGAQQQRPYWIVAGLATFAQTPWTLIVMMSTNTRLCAIAESKAEQAKVGSELVVGLLRQWAWMNAVRGCLPLVGGLSGLWAVLVMGGDGAVRAGVKGD